MLVRYYDNTVSSYNYDIEQLLLKQKEILEDLKQQNDYYATHDLIQKYERAIQVLQRHVTRKRKKLQIFKNLKKRKDFKSLEEEYEDDMETTEILLSNYPYFSYEVYRKYATRNTLLDSENSSQPEQDKTEKTMTTITTQTDSSLGIETHSQQLQTQQILEQSMNKLYSMVSAINENQKRVQKIQSLQTVAENASPLFKSHSFRIPKEKTSVSVGTIEEDSDTRKRANSLSSQEKAESNQETNQGTEERLEVSKISELDDQLLKLKQREQLLKEREAKLIFRELNFEKQLNALALQKQNAISPNALYSPELTGKYRISIDKNNNGFVENSKTCKPNWFDRLMDRVVGQSPENCYALICSRCCSHNGLMMMDDAENHSGYKCWNCNYLNIKSSSVSDSASVVSEVTDVLYMEEHDEETNETNENEEKQEAEENTEVED